MWWVSHSVLCFVHLLPQILLGIGPLGSIPVLRDTFTFTVVLDVATKAHRPASRAVWMIRSSKFVPEIKHFQMLTA